MINRNILFYKIHKSGFTGRVIDTLRNLYQKTTYRIKSNNKISEPTSETSGVNQGGTASPFLFRIYLSDLKDCLDEYTGICLSDEILIHVLWADDLYLVSNDTAGSQKQLKGLTAFCGPNQMAANVIKTKVMVYGKSSPVHLLLYGNPIEPVNAIQMLRGDIFKNNPEYLINRARGAIFGILRRVKK